MNATLYDPLGPPRAVAADGLVLPASPAGFAQVTDEVARLLGCARGLVDVLDAGADYVAYSVFDCEGQTNHAAMLALSRISGHVYDMDDQEQVLCGPVLVITSRVDTTVVGA